MQQRLSPGLQNLLILLESQETFDSLPDTFCMRTEIEGLKLRLPIIFHQLGRPLRLTHFSSR